jgi:predicted aspartyl protease
MKSAMASALLATMLCHGAQAAAPLSPAGDGHLTVPTMVNGKGPFPFILDTGAEMSAVYQWFTEKARLPKKPGPPDKVSGMTGSSYLSAYMIDTLRMDGHVAKGINADLLPNRRDKGRQAGVLGNDFLADAIAVFDFPCKHIEIHPRPAGMAQMAAIVGDQSAPITATRIPDTELVSVPVSINGAASIALFDTGNRETKINSSFARAAGLDPDSSAFQAAAPILGATLVSMTPRTGSIGAVKVGAVSLGNVHAQVIDMPVMKSLFGDRPAMVLGADLMQDFRVVYDHQQNRIWLAHSMCAKRQ